MNELRRILLAVIGMDLSALLSKVEIIGAECGL